MKILVVDDDIDIRESLRAILEDAAYTVADAANGQEALEYLRTSHVLPDLILLDLAMPIMNGVEFRETQLRNGAWASIPVFVLTAAGNPVEKTRGLRADLVMPKPFDLEELKRAIAKVVRKPRSPAGTA